MANEFKIKKGLIVKGSGSTILDIQGSQGQLFSVTDSLSGSLFSVNDISGLPILQVSSDDSVKLGTFNAEAIKVQGSTATMTGSLFGTSSWAISASLALTASYFGGSITSASYAATSSFVTGSNVYGPYGSNSIISASYATNAGTSLSSSYALSSTSASYATNAETSLSSSYAATASLAPLYLPLTGGTISGNLTIIGTASFTYTTASIVEIGAATITLNTDYPATRFGGINVIDSGSFGNSSTGSLLWDSLNNKWIYSNPSGSTYDGGMLISGPRNTSGLGNETGMDDNFVAVGQGGDHIRPSQIYSSGSIHQITGSLTIIGPFNQGSSSLSSGTYTHAQGFRVTASAPYSHAEGVSTQATQTGAHAEGFRTLSSGVYSHTEGGYVTASGFYSHAEGSGSKATNYAAHAEGILTLSSGQGSHTEGINTWAYGTGSHAEGYITTASGDYSHAEGGFTVASNIGAHAEGTQTQATGQYSHAEGYITVASGEQSHAEGVGSIASGTGAHAEGGTTHATGFYSHAEGSSTYSPGEGAHAEGSGTVALGATSHTEGVSTNTGVTTGYKITSSTPGVLILGSTYGDISLKFVIGSTIILHNSAGDTVGTTTVSSTSWDGTNTTVNLTNTYYDPGTDSVIGNISYGVANWGGDQILAGKNAHAEGISSVAIGNNSHAEGNYAEAWGDSSHAEGNYTTAVGKYSHAEGVGFLVGTETSVTTSATTVIDLVTPDITLSSTSVISINTSTLVISGDYSAITFPQPLSSLTLYDGATTLPINFSFYKKTPVLASATYDGGLNETTFDVDAQFESIYYSVQGTGLIATEDYSHAEGLSTLAVSPGSHAEGAYTIAQGTWSHAEGQGTKASGQTSHTEGYQTTASGNWAHAEGWITVAETGYSHTEGYLTSATGTGAHAEGSSTTAQGVGSHTEGFGSLTTGDYSHAEGSSTARGQYSHAEGVGTETLGIGSHAEGYSAKSRGEYSHAEGYYTVASGSYQHVQGQYNISSSAQSAFIIGNGTADNARSNLIFASGSNVQITGSLRGQVNALSIASNTASINLASNNFFTVTLVNAANTHISASNILPGQTANIKVLQGSAGTGTVSFNSAIKSGSFYTGSAVANAVDIVTFISFDSSTLYMSAVTNLK